MSCFQEFLCKKKTSVQDCFFGVLDSDTGPSSLSTPGWCCRVKTSSRSNWDSAAAPHRSSPHHTFLFFAVFCPAPYFSVCSRSVTISMACESIMQITVISAKEQPFTLSHRYTHTHLSQRRPLTRPPQHPRDPCQSSAPLWSPSSRPYQPANHLLLSLRASCLLLLQL